LGYPEIHYLTSPLRAASVRAGDPQAVNVWVGSGFQNAKSAPGAEIVKSLT
jgi:nitronate monooxygenase